MATPVPIFTDDPKNKKRQKVNFMIGTDIITTIKMWIPAGERSNFVNGALSEALKKIVRQKASDEMDRIRKTYGWKMTDEEIKKAINYGRK